MCSVYADPRARHVLHHSFPTRRPSGLPITATMVLDSKVWDEGGLTKDWESLDNIDRNLVRAVIAGEDGKFCLHSGFDTEAIAKAAARNAQGGRIRGGSTITQQTAKNVFLWQGGGFFRKGLEAWFRSEEHTSELQSLMRISY